MSERSTGIVSVSYVRSELIENWNIKSLMAPFWRWYWNDREGASMKYRDVTVNMTPDRFYLVPAHMDYTSLNVVPIEHFHIHFYLSWGFADKRIFSFKLDREIQLGLQRAFKLCKKERTDAIEAELQLIGSSMVFDGLKRIPFDRFELSPADLLMENVVTQMRDHLETGISNDQLAEIAGMSLSKFLREFKAYFHTTPAAYLNLQRVERAATLLDREDISIEEISDRTGFYDRYHLTKVFKRYRGITPAAYRKHRR